jgi:thiamine-phosphate pyrophosphorylase
VSARDRIGRLHVITDENLQDRFSHVHLAGLAAKGGADRVQYREKRALSTRELIQTARAMKEALESSGAELVIDDRADVALAARVPAVHLGRDDLEPEVARAILGEDAVIGGTANDIEQALRVASTPVDYLGVGPVFGTTSKARPAPVLGLEGLRRIVEAVDRPVIAIGNITAERVGDVLAAGAYGIAVLSSVVLDPDPRAATRRLRGAVDAVQGDPALRR